MDPEARRGYALINHLSFLLPPRKAWIIGRFQQSEKESGMRPGVRCATYVSFVPKDGRDRGASGGWTGEGAGYGLRPEAKRNFLFVNPWDQVGRHIKTSLRICIAVFSFKAEQIFPRRHSPRN
jgi:hypothetical protein